MSPNQKPVIPQARKDGRPLYYDLDEGARVSCYYCERNGLTGIAFGRREAVMNDPANSPASDGLIYTISISHLPGDAVIYDPVTNTCRNKRGTEVWTE
jgi:hypothetical protein